MTFTSRRQESRRRGLRLDVDHRQANVPAGAVDGKVRVKDNFGNSSDLSRAELAIKPRSELGSAGELEVAEAETSPQRAYYFGVHYPHLTYVIRSDKPLNDLRIDVVDRDGSVVRSYFRDNVAAELHPAGPLERQGLRPGGPPPTAPYSFQIRAQSGARARRASGASATTGFKLFGYIFPLRGRHTYGDGIGAPRAGHTHEGQDVLSACGPRIVAARGGRVQYAGYQSAAGNYVVIDGKSTGKDFVYMHMVQPSPLREGQVVHTGQKIGNVGETGDATGCHLALRDVVRARLVRGRSLSQSDPLAEALGPLQLTPPIESTISGPYRSSFTRRVACH